MTETLPLADPGREALAAELFSTGLSPELYAAKLGHRWQCFSLDDIRYQDQTLNGWIQRLGDIFFNRNGAPSVAELRSTLLSIEEQKAIALELENQRCSWKSDPGQ